MKNRTMTIVAAIAVAVIWGMIIFRLFFDKDQQEISFDLPPTPSMEWEAEELKAYSLIGDYRDPFMGKSSRRRVRSENSHGATETKPRPQPPEISPKQSIKWPSLKYQGFIAQESERTFLFITVDGVDQIVQPNEKIGELEVVHFDRDSISIAYHEEIKIIYRQP